MDTKSKSTAALLKSAVSQYGKQSADKRANDMVARGVVNKKGELTTRVGGTAKPESEK